MLTAAQVVAIACSIAKVPAMAKLGGQRLNEVLVDIALDQNLDMVRRTVTVAVTPGTQTYPLPAAFLRARECFYNVNGAVFTVVEYDLAEFDSLFTGPNNSAYPELYAIDLAAQTIQFYPMPVIPLSVTLRYMDDSVEIVSPETNAIVPWFQKQSYLIKATAAKLMEITDDTRQGVFEAQADEQLRRYLRLNNGNTLKTVSLDPRRFKVGQALSPTKLYP